MRGQTDRPQAPLGFELNNPWKVPDQKASLFQGTFCSPSHTAGEAYLLSPLEATIEATIEATEPPYESATVHIAPANWQAFPQENKAVKDGTSIKSNGNLSHAPSPCLACVCQE